MYYFCERFAKSIFSEVCENHVLQYYVTVVENKNRVNESFHMNETTSVDLDTFIDWRIYSII